MSVIVSSGTSRLLCGAAGLELCKGGKTKMDSLLNTCAWCSKEVPEHFEVCSITATTKYKTLLEGHEGTFIPLPLTLASRTVHGAVVTSDSAAKKDGWDIIFMTCGLSCAKFLKAALNSESSVGKVSH